MRYTIIIIIVVLILWFPLSPFVNDGACQDLANSSRSTLIGKFVWAVLWAACSCWLPWS